MHIPEISSSTMILPLAAENASLDQVGGKGANLSHLARGGYPVPGGFLISVAAYHAAVTRKDLQPQIEAALASGKLDLPQDLEQISQQIRALFQTGIIPADLVQILLQQYCAMGSPAVAVRSSATAEDLPDMSFAGQQDTYLNIQGESSLLQAVADCWGSLWTARAIGYRHRQKVGQFNLALAVVVQEMVQSEASGVLFTANPLTGLRSEIVRSEEHV
jgi:phosphoenolpyruvate synthase/pyruvate phosphate dikinase